MVFGLGVGVLFGFLCVVVWFFVCCCLVFCVLLFGFLCVVVWFSSI